MQEKIEQQISHIKSKHFVISDEEKATGYLKQVGFYRLSRYFSVFKSEIENGEKIDFQRVIDCYVFDKQLRTQCMGMLEIIEVYLKNLLILYIGKNYDQRSVFQASKWSEQNQFIKNKIQEISVKNQVIAKYIKKQGYMSSDIFFNNISFGESKRYFESLQTEYKLQIAEEFGIKLTILDSWLSGMVLLRNSCSHAENIFNKIMVHALKGDVIKENFGENNMRCFISYLVVLQVFKKSLIPSYKWEEGLEDLMKKYNINFSHFLKIKTTFPNEHTNVEAWKVFVHTIYTKYVKK